MLFFFFLWPHPWHMEVPRPGTESKLQLRARPQCGNIRSLSHSTGPGTEPTIPQRQPDGSLIPCAIVETLFMLACLLFFLPFWPPHGIWSFRARIRCDLSCSCNICHTCGNLDPLTCCAEAGIEPASWHCRDAAYPRAPQQV